MNKLISMDKRYKTRDGKFVRVLCVDNEDKEFPVIASVKGVALNFTSTGAFHTIPDYKHELDLIEVVQEHELWVEIFYTGNSHIRAVYYLSEATLRNGIESNSKFYENEYNLIATKKITYLEGETCL